MDQDDLKRLAARAALEHVVPGAVIGVGSGSTVSFFVEALARSGLRVPGAVAASARSEAALARAGIPVLDLNAVETLPVYVDGADEIDHGLRMIKGGGGALTREKIVASAAATFVCIADASKRVSVLGRFPLPVEVIPMAKALVSRAMRRFGGDPVERAGFVTDNGNAILDVRGLSIPDPVALEAEINQIPGVVCNGLFARRPADVLLLAAAGGVERLRRPGA